MLRAIIEQFCRLLKASAGHNVTLFHITTEPESVRSPHPNISTIVAVISKKERSEKMDEIGQMMWGTTLHAAKLPFIYLMMGSSVARLRDQVPNQIREILNTDWDLLIPSSIFNGHTISFALALKRRKNIPYILFHPTTTIGADASALATAQNWAIAPNLFGVEPATFDTTYDARRFMDRGLNFLEYASEYLASTVTERIILPMTIKKFGEANYDHNAFINGATMHFADGLELVGFPNAHVPEIRSVTGNCAKAKPLPKEYADFVEDPSSKGTIYVAFGTFVPWDSAPLEKKRALLEGLAKFTDYRIIFSFNGVFPKDVPSHIRLVKWAPQFDVLAHPKTKVFLTHGGLKSVKESLCSSTPMLVMPMFAEQNRNAKLVIRAGIGGSLNKYYFDSSAVVDALHRLLNTSAYEKRVAHLRAMFLDRPVADLDSAAHFVKRTIRLANAAKQRALAVAGIVDDGVTPRPPPFDLFHRRTAVKMNLLEYYNAEILLVILSAIWIINIK